MTERRTSQRGDAEGMDVLIVGGGSAGTAAACLLAQSERRVLLIDRPPQQGVPHAHAWISAAATPLLKKIGVTWKHATATAVREVAFHTADFKKHQALRLARPAAYFVETASWTATLRQVATQAGATCMDQATITAVQARENDVVATCASGASYPARLAIIADGAGSVSMTEIGLPAHRVRSPRYAAQLAWPAAKASKLGAGVLHFVLNLDGGQGMATFWSTGEVETVTTIAGEPATARSELANIVAWLDRTQRVSRPATADASTSPLLIVPAAHALEMDSHVGKRTLVIGEAGGFVAAPTGEGLYPGIWSAAIAATVIHDALEGPHTQDALRAFDTEWRTRMADYLRPPNTDLQFLLPLIFANEQMAARLAGAFLSGENL
ncbi:MAG: FAD-dependent monooxygenase [Phycisphaerae bacterium]|nr:FAD-dependent monooxygenase [Phycisphaerae bacterium]